jgi:hypothetical protein
VAGPGGTVRARSAVASPRYPHRTLVECIRHHALAISTMYPKDWTLGHLVGLPTLPGALDLYPYGRYHDCSRRFFLVLLHRQRPE